MIKRQFDRFTKTFFDARLDDNPINDCLDGVTLTSRQIRRRASVDNLAINSRTDKSRLADLLKDIPMTAFSPNNHRREDHHLPTFAHCENALDDRRDTLLRNWHVAFRTVRLPCPCIKQSQVVVDFRCRRKRASNSSGADFLIDTDRRRQPHNRIDVRAFQLRKVLPSSRGKAFEIATLTFCKHRVECERTLSAAANSGDHNQLVARNVDVDVLQIVNSCASDTNPITGRSRIHHCLWYV